MTQPNVPAETPPSEPSVWADIAAELRKIASDVDDLIGQPAPRLFQINLQPHCGPTHPPTPKERAETVTAVDTVAQILLGRSAKTEPVGGNTFHHGARGSRGPVSFSIYQQVADPALVDPGEEIARLRAENEKLRAAAGLDHSRDDQGPQQIGQRVEPHFESGREPGGVHVSGQSGWHVKGCYGATGQPCVCPTAS